MNIETARWVRVALGLVLLASVVPTARAETPPSNRVALVVGEGAYRKDPRPTAPDDAGLVAQVLAGAGFDVTGARDLDGDGLRRALRDFLDKAAATGPDGVAVVYFAGKAVQADGDDYLVPVDARLARSSDVPIEALRLADFTHALAALPIQARVVVVDGAYVGSPGSAGGPAATPGLALMDAEQGELLAFNAAPGTAAPLSSEPYGIYAQALVAAVKQGGVPVGEVFARTRLAVNQVTGGTVVPWDSDKLTRSFAFFDRAPSAPAMASAQIPFAALEKRPLRDFPPDQAYDVVLARDTLPDYAEFLTVFPNDPLARRVRLIMTARREALFWRAAFQGNTPGGFWTYLVRYPKGPHAGDARRRLSRLSAAAVPPLRFVPLGFDVPPPGPDEIIVEGPFVFDAPGLPPPPPPPVFLLPPPVVVIRERPAPAAVRGLLPVPVPLAIPFVRAPLDPGTIAPPRGVKGEYPRPRPFTRGPNGDGLVVLATPPSPVSPPPMSATRPSSAQPAPTERPPSGGRPAPLPAPIVPLVSPAPPPAAPIFGVPHSPRLPDVPASRPVPAPAVPVSPAQPVPPVAPSPPPGRPAPPVPSGGVAPPIPTGPGKAPPEPNGNGPRTGPASALRPHPAAPLAATPSTPVRTPPAPQPSRPVQPAPASRAAPALPAPPRPAPPRPGNPAAVTRPVATPASRPAARERIPTLPRGLRGDRSSAKRGSRHDGQDGSAYARHA